VLDLGEKREGPEHPYRVVDWEAMRTSENAQKAKFVELLFHALGGIKVRTEGQGR
jgi:hypothetical protein